MRSSLIFALITSLTAILLAFYLSAQHLSIDKVIHRAFTSFTRNSSNLARNTTDSIVHQAIHSPTMSAVGTSRRPARAPVLAKETAEGVGATVRRSIGGAEVRNFSPFLSRSSPQHGCINLNCADFWVVAPLQCWTTSKSAKERDSRIILIEV